MSRIISILFLTGLIVFAGTSCKTTKPTAYFYNVKDTVLSREVEDIQPRLQRNDILSISISSLNEEASKIFNTPNASSSSTSTAAGSTTSSSGYLVNSDGNVQLPILGNIKAAGLTKKQLKESITSNKAVTLFAKMDYLLAYKWHLAPQPFCYHRSRL